MGFVIKDNDLGQLLFKDALLAGLGVCDDVGLNVDVLFQIIKALLNGLKTKKIPLFLVTVILN